MAVVISPSTPPPMPIIALAKGWIEIASASHNRCSKNVRVQVVIAELELGNIERKMLLADFMKSSNHSAPFDGFGYERRRQTFDVETWLAKPRPDLDLTAITDLASKP
jgi:hypothetical protein